VKIYNKLIRDKIPQLLDSNSVSYEVSELDHEQYMKKLNEKLVEELDEYRLATTKVEQIEELADLVEVIYAIAAHKGVSIKDFDAVRIKKKEKRGGFEKKLLLVSTEDSSD
jgi:predicted house-cleaning noncanonical NTP pyrophosphatase (MazG superfamily)